MPLTTYAELQTSAANFVNRTDLTSAIPDFITLAEAQINRRLRAAAMISRSSASVAAEFAAVPTDFLAPIDAVLSTGEVLDCLSIDAILQRKRETGQTAGTPQAYAVVGSELQFWPAPSSALEVDLTYYAKIPALSDSNTSNWLLSAHPDAYLYGTLVQAAEYLDGDPRVDAWARLYIAALEDITTSEVRNAQGARLTPRTTQFA